MAKRKVIKFVFQGHRQIETGEFYSHKKDFTEWVLCKRSEAEYQVYHRIETEEEVPRWRAKKDSQYFFVSDELAVTDYYDDYSDIDDAIYKSGNYFQTKEQAQEYLNHCKIFFENN